MRCLPVLGLVALTNIAAAERPRLLVLDGLPPTEVAPATAAYNTIFLNRCASGCAVKQGANDDRIDSSDIVHGSHVLTGFPYGDAAWASVMSCVRDTFSSFNVKITDVDPGTASHFEIMIGGSPGDLGFPTNVGGVSSNGCGQSYIPNALVFDFAKVWSPSATTCGPACIEDICSTAAQEIGHSIGMDHSHNAADPMTYFNINTPRYFQNLAYPCVSYGGGGGGPGGGAGGGAGGRGRAGGGSGGS